MLWYFSTGKSSHTSKLAFPAFLYLKTPPSWWFGRSSRKFECQFFIKSFVNCSSWDSQLSRSCWMWRVFAIQTPTKGHPGEWMMFFSKILSTKDMDSNVEGNKSSTPAPTLVRANPFSLPKWRFFSNHWNSPLCSSQMHTPREVLKVWKTEWLSTWALQGPSLKPFVHAAISSTWVGGPKR